MIEILTITENTVGWKDEDDELYVYPRSCFPVGIKIDHIYEYSGGEFREVTNS